MVAEVKWFVMVDGSEVEGGVDEGRRDGCMWRWWGGAGWKRWINVLKTHNVKIPL